LAVGLALVLAAPSVLAQCQTDQNCWPPFGVTCAYPAPGPVFYPGTPAGIRNIEMFDPNACAPYPPTGGPSIDSFFDIIIIIELTMNGGTDWLLGVFYSPCGVRVQPPIPVGPDQVFDAEMLQLQIDLQGPITPPGMMLRESPSQPSVGQTIKRVLGSGQYRIDSFFDVFTELSLDGGQNWFQGSQPLHVTTVDRYQTASRTSTWGTVKLLYR